MGHHGGRGTKAATMVHRVLLIDMCLVLDLCVGRVLTYRDNMSHLFYCEYFHKILSKKEYVSKFLPRSTAV